MQVRRHIYGVRENPSAEDFNKPTHLTDQKHVIISLKYTLYSHKSQCA